MCKILLILVLLLYLKWILMVIFFPFQAICGQLMRRNWSLKKIAVFCAPYLAWEWLLRWGWQRYMLYQVSTLPSCHLRKFIYKALGASVGPKVVFHFRTEIRYPHILRYEEVVKSLSFFWKRNVIFIENRTRVSIIPKFLAS